MRNLLRKIATKFKTEFLDDPVQMKALMPVIELVMYVCIVALLLFLVTHTRQIAAVLNWISKHL